MPGFDVKYDLGDGFLKKKIDKYSKICVMVWIAAICTPAAFSVDIPGDIAEPYGQVDTADLMKVAEWWLVSVCDMLDNCFGADISGPEGPPDGIVNLHDMAVIAAHWLEGIPE